MKQRKITEEELNQVKAALKKERERRKKEFDLHLVKVLRLKPNKKYWVFFPKSAGLFAADLAQISYEWVDVSFLVEDTEGIIAIEK